MATRPNKMNTFKIKHQGIPVVAQWVKNPTSIHEDAGLIPGLTQWVKDLAFGELWCRSQMRPRIWHCCGCDLGQQLQLPFDS